MLIVLEPFRHNDLSRLSRLPIELLSSHVMEYLTGEANDYARASSHSTTDEDVGCDPLERRRRRSSESFQDDESMNRRRSSRGAEAKGGGGAFKRNGARNCAISSNRHNSADARYSEARFALIDPLIFIYPLE